VAEQEITIDTAVEAVESAIPAVETQTPTEPEWELPSWSSNWDETEKGALKALYGYADGREHFERLVGKVGKISESFGRQGHEYGNYRRQMDPIAEVIGPYVQQFQMNGMTPQQGLTQVLSFADSLARNPDNTYPMLAHMYKPSNAADVLRTLAQAWGSDLGQLAQEQPYIDPAINEMVTPLMQRLQELEQAQYQHQQTAVQGRQKAVLQSLDAFLTAKDESGAPKHPHADRLQNQMASLISGGLVDRYDPDVLSKAYDMALRLDPELGADLAQKRALAAAAQSTAVAKNAADASRNVSGKPNGKASGPSSIDEALAAAEKQFAA
jgi:hypothetical protein